MTIEVDRSRILAYQSCPRQRYLGYHHLGKGLQKKAKALPLQFGSAFHEGSADLLLGRGIEAAVLTSQLYLSNAFAAAEVGFDGEQPGDEGKALEYGKEEQAAMAEALLRAWWAWEGEGFLKNFEIIECEQEGRAALTDEIVLMFRPDALVRDRESGDRYVVSWKTAATYTKRTLDQCRHDMQSISEVWGLQQTTGENVEGVLYKFALKGKRDKDEWDGLYKQGTHLVYGWKKLAAGESEDGAEWAWKYKWDSDEINPKTGKPVQRTLGKGWKKVPIWSEYEGGVKAWVEALAANQIAPRHVNALEQVFPQSLPVERRVDEVERWKRQVVAQEMRINDSLLALSLERDEGDLDYHFPQHTHSCHSYSGCPFIPICWEGAPAEPGELYQIRTSNHPEEGDEDDA